MGDDGGLDALRIRQRAALRRAIYRSRSHAIIAATACSVLAVQLIILLTHRPPLTWFVSYVLLALIAAAAAVHFVNRALALHQEARQARSEPAQATPDFSTLGDGSDQVRRLEEITD